MEQNTAPDTLAEILDRHATTPAPPPLPSEPAIPVDLADLETDAPVIPRGKARLALAGALFDTHRAIMRLESVASAIARQLDADDSAATWARAHGYRAPGGQ
jgi:hypothetical protein